MGLYRMLSPFPNGLDEYSFYQFNKYLLGACEVRDTRHPNSRQRHRPCPQGADQGNTGTSNDAMLTEANRKNRLKDLGKTMQMAT